MHHLYRLDQAGLWQVQRQTGVHTVPARTAPRMLSAAHQAAKRRLLRLKHARKAQGLVRLPPIHSVQQSTVDLQKRVGGLKKTS